ncbi:MAG: hypothetical protein NWE93_01375 [Candidatus Bathyarchaeota archaeon]|nr:hypothetical protein [Candidatus Bathyarchaeota archaeon]
MFIVVQPVFAQTIVKPPEFTLELVDHSYDVPPTTKSTTDPYTNKTTVTTVPGYHVDNKTIDATIKNNGASFYNFRYKPTYGNDRWSYYPFNEFGNYIIIPSAIDLSNIINASTTDYTVVSLTFLPKNIPEEGQIDIQIQGLLGYFEKNPSGMRGAGFPTYDFKFVGERSDWSPTQTFKMPATSDSPSPTPTVPEFSWLVIVPLLLSILLVTLIVRYRKTANLSK